MPIEVRDPGCFAPILVSPSGRRHAAEMHGRPSWRDFWVIASNKLSAGRQLEIGQHVSPVRIVRGKQRFENCMVLRIAVMIPRHPAFSSAPCQTFRRAETLIGSAGILERFLNKPRISEFSHRRPRRTAAHALCAVRSIPGISTAIV
jgi:hypothetical protein